MLHKFVLLWKFFVQQFLSFLYSSLSKVDLSFSYFPGPTTRFLGCRSQKRFGCLWEWRKSEFPGKHPWQSTISEKNEGACPLSFVEGVGGVFLRASMQSFYNNIWKLFTHERESWIMNHTPLKFNNNANVKQTVFKKNLIWS